MENEENVENDFEQNGWNNLNSYCLERIFSFLTPRERATASIVCKSWAQIYECPSFWNVVSLSFSKGNRSRPCFNAQSIVRRFGQYFRQLTILCRRERRRSHKFGHRRITEFFRLMLQADVQLDSIRMPRLMVLNRVYKAEPLCVSEDMTNFLKSQRELIDVDFNNGDIQTLPGLMILESLVAENVQHLRLQNFFHIAQEVLNINYSERYMAAIDRFHGLRSLWLNYRCLSDEVMNTLAISLEDHLETFGVLIEKCHTISTTLSDDSWNTLKTKCPKMQVHLKLDLRYMQFISVISYISPQIPLASVEYRNLDLWSPRSDSRVFDYIRSNFATTLTSACFELRGYHSLDIRPEVTSLVRSCPNLETLTLRMRARVVPIPELFEGMLEAVGEMDRASLKVFRVTFRGLNKAHRDMRIDLQSSYVPMFRDIGIQLIMKMKK